VPASWSKPALGAAALFSALFAVLLFAVVGDPRPRLAATNSRVLASGVALTVPPGQERCEQGQFVPAETTVLRVYAGSDRGAEGEPLQLSIADAGTGEVVYRRRVDGGYPSGPLDVPVRPPGRDLDNGEVCIENLGAGAMAFAGNRTREGAVVPADDVPQGDLRVPPEAPADEEVRIDLFRPGSESLWALGPEVARRFALFKPAFAGPWLMWAVLALALAAVPAAVLLAARQPSPPGPAPGGRGATTWSTIWVCAALAALNAALWAMATPPFQVPDEPGHFGYAQYLAESGRPPQPWSGDLPTPTGEDGILLGGVPFSVEGRPSWSSTEDEHVRRQLDQQVAPTHVSAARGAATYPPAYYAYEAVPARLGSSLPGLDRLYLMRLFSALLAGITAGSAVLFLRELLPGTPWAWPVGGLAVAFQPVLGFMSGGVNNDAMVYAAGAVLLALVARCFRRGLTPRRGLAIGAVAAAGVLAKMTMVGLLPGTGLALLLLWWRAGEGRRPVATRGLVAGGASFGLIVAAWLAVDTLLFHRPLSAATGSMVSEAVADATTVRGQLAYLWQFFLPRLPFMADAFPGYPEYPVWDVYVQGFVGRFGWFQYGFPRWVDLVGLAALVVVAALAGVEVARSRETLRRRWPELAAYAAMLAGTLVLVAVTGYRLRAISGLNFEQPRYLFALLPLYGAVVALAARGAGRRWGRTAGVVLVTLVAWHSLFSLLLTINRYYV
jgi:hypothetical protein